MRHNELEPIYDTCLRDENCRSDDPRRHFCPQCAELIALSNRFAELTNAEPWQLGVGSDGPDPPSNFLDARDRAAWRRNWRLRCEIEAEIAKRKVAHAE